MKTLELHAKELGIHLLAQIKFFPSFTTSVLQHGSEETQEL